MNFNAFFCFYFELGVFDGHGGGKVSKYIKQTLYSNFLQLMPENKNKWNDKIIYCALKNAVKKVDFEVTKVRSWNRQGSTLTAIYINKNKNSFFRYNQNPNADNSKNSKISNYDDHEKSSDESRVEPNYSILTINVGDSRIVLARGRKAIDLTSDHKPNMR